MNADRRGWEEGLLNYPRKSAFIRCVSETDFVS